MPADKPFDTVPRIELRVPGPWASPGEFRDAVDRVDGDYRFSEDGSLEHVRTGRRFELAVSAPDDEIAELFQATGRLDGREVGQVAAHKVKVHVCGPGGSPDAARAAM